jgi:hypothetical protein
MAKGRKTGGRTKGTPNIATEDIKSLAKQYGSEAIDVLVWVMRTPALDTKSRVAAAKELLDRGYGKATQIIASPNGGPAFKLYLFDPENAADAGTTAV